MRRPGDVEDRTRFSISHDPYPRLASRCRTAWVIGCEYALLCISRRLARMITIIERWRDTLDGFFSMFFFRRDSRGLRVGLLSANGHPSASRCVVRSRRIPGGSPHGSGSGAGKPASPKFCIPPVAPGVYNLRAASGSTRAGVTMDAKGRIIVNAPFQTSLSPMCTAEGRCDGSPHSHPSRWEQGWWRCCHA